MSFARTVRLACAVLLTFVTAGLVSAQTPTEGILLLAHGGQPTWNQHVLALAEAVNSKQPTEVAFGMASRPAIDAAVKKLVARGVTGIVAVPLFVSSYSSVVTSTEYLLGQREDAPADLAIFAKMNHGAHAMPAAPGAAADPHAGHAMPAADGTSPVQAPVPIRMSAALNRHPTVATILAARAKQISRDPSKEAVVVVAHGPVPDDENQKWLDDMRVLAGQLGQTVPFRSIDYLTVRDDAPAPIRDAATAELRALVQRRIGEQSRVLIVPLLLSYGGIEQGIRKRLDGLAYEMPAQALIPDERLASWVLEMAASR